MPFPRSQFFPPCRTYLPDSVVIPGSISFRFSTIRELLAIEALSGTDLQKGQTRVGNHVLLTN